MDQKTIWAVLAGGVCATGGAGLAMMGRCDAPPVAAQPVAQVRGEELGANTAELVAIEALADELRHLREELASRREAIGDSPPGPALETVQRELHELRAAIERRAAAQPAAELDLGSKGPGRSRLFVRTAGREDEEEDDERLSSQVRLWSYQRSLDEFGPPDHVSREKGSMVWTYSEANGAVATALVFCDGFVVNAYTADD